MRNPSSLFLAACSCAQQHHQRQALGQWPQCRRGGQPIPPPPHAHPPTLHQLLAEVELPLEDTELDNRNYDDEKQQVGGFGTPHGKIHIKQQINHDGEVNRARCVHARSTCMTVSVSLLSSGCVGVWVDRSP